MFKLFKKIQELLLLQEENEHLTNKILIGQEEHAKMAKRGMEINNEILLWRMAEDTARREAQLSGEYGSEKIHKLIIKHHKKLCKKTN